MFPISVNAEILPDYVSTLINDYADVIPQDVEDALSKKLIKLRENNDVQLVVLTINSRAEYDHGGDLATFSTDLFNTWGIGDAELNNGVLVLIVKNDREMRLEIGEGYDRGYNRVARSVISESFLPEFRKDDYATGIASGVDATISRIIKPHLRGEIPSDFEEAKGEPGWFAKNWYQVIGGLIIIGIAFRKKIAEVLGLGRKCPNCGSRNIHRHNDTLTTATTTLPGEGRRTDSCSDCDYRNTKNYAISKMRSKSSSSRRSFGGGRSSGGGASGKW